jgi:bifunctional UDP-N-acetylglucosamine pyrophosphorylase/glucosamine-1-phosphate N-acetyltransferase
MQTVILAAGTGTRLWPLTERVPKPMLPVAGDPMVARVADAACEAGATELVVVVGYGGGRVRAHLGERHHDVPVTYVDQPERRGTADAVRLAAPEITGPFALLNGDGRYAPADIARLFDAAPALGVHRVDDPSAYGVVSTSDGVADAVVEKPTSPSSDLVSTGACVLPEEAAARAADVERSARGEYEMTDVLAAVIERHAVRAVEFETWRDVGRPWELLEANVTFLEGLERRVAGAVDPAATLRGRVAVEPGARVDAGVVIEGPALVCEDATVGPNAYVRGGTVVGEGAHVGHAVEVKQSLLLAGATAGHLSYVGDSVVGHDANLGAGTVVANLRHDDRSVRMTVKDERVSTGRRKFGAVVGPDAKTGIDTSLAPGVTLGAGATTKPGETLLRDRSDGEGPR